MNHALKRVLSFAVALVLVLSMVPAAALHVHAAGALDGLTVPGLSVSYGNVYTVGTTGSLSSTVATKGSLSWTASGTTITGVATGYTQIAKKAVGAILTLTNNLDSEATLKFAYTLTGGGSVSGISDGAYEGVLAAGESLAVTLISPKGEGVSNTLAITGLSLISTTASDATVTFQTAQGGSYTVNGAAVTAETSFTAAAGTEYALAATAASGYQFFGWYNATVGAYVSYDAETALLVAADQTIYPVFVDAQLPLFAVGHTHFSDLAAADAFASAGTSKTIVLISDGTISGDYTISAGNTLLIPFDSANTLYTTEPGCTSSLGNNAAWVEPTAYRTLTLAEGATITVNGAISVSGQHAAAGGASGKHGGSPSGPLGMIRMVSGSEIIVASGANLYCWGYIYGGGSVTVQNGGTTHENFQVMDFRGGNITSLMAMEYWVFPLSQYYVQNMEVATTFEYGAKEKVWTSLYISGQVYSAGVDFIGEGAMFVAEEGASITKTYIPAEDRLQIDVNGSGAINSMSLSLGGTAINSSAFVLPITSNMSININSGTTTLKQSLALLPGVELSIAEGAVLALASGTPNEDAGIYTGAENLFVYDADEWTYGISVDDGETIAEGYYVHPNRRFTAVSYSPGRSYTRTESDLKDVVVDINGTLVTDGFMYTTLGGASVISSAATGKLVMNNGAGQDGLTVQANQGASTVSYMAIPIASVQLKNADGTYTDTTDTEAGGYYSFCAKCGVWHAGDACKIPTSVQITWMNGETVLATDEVAYNAVPVYQGAAPEKAYDDASHYTFAGWTDAAGNTYLLTDALPAATEDASYQAYFTAGAHADTDDHNCDVCGKVLTQCADGNADHKCDVCGKTLTECADGNADHKCDLCGKTLSECADDNKDHKCDLCGKTLSECADNNADHKCDVCGKTLSECADTNADHKCDLCGKILTECADGNADHKCDLCGKTLTECADGNADHKCDLCGKTLSECADNNADHKCDVCGKTLTECADGNKDHKCDVCGKTLTQCADGDNDHKCDLCGKVLTDCTDADNNHFCDICGQRVSYCTDSNGDHTCDICGVKQSECTDENKDHKCDLCGKTISECADGNADHKCDVCGKTLSECADDNADHKCDLCGKTLSECADGNKDHKCDLCGKTLSECADNNADHKCDVCGKTLSECADNNADHKCDICGKTLSECADGNADHKCDVCGKTLTECADENKDHKCDLCGKTISECADANKDHKCDVCGKTLSECADNNADHKCDVCGKTLSECADNNADHKCDVCGKTLSECADENKDHNCDLCGKTISECADNDADHNCDVCGKTLSECADNDADHLCDVCGKALSQCADDNDDHKCDLCGKVLTDCADADNDHYCDLCGEKISDHSYNNGTCVCGHKHGWTVSDEGKQYYADNVMQTGWMELESVWYYLDVQTGYAATGVARVPYNTVLGYGPNASDVAYAESKGNVFIDKDTGLFVFDGDGVLQTSLTGFVTYQGATRWAVKGLISWHPGLVETEGAYYYFTGDTTLGGNTMSTGNVYVQRDSTALNAVIGGVYTFAADGKLCKYHGITDVNGKLYYYENYQLMLGAGLIKVDGDYYYVRSSGALVVGTEYWVSNTNGYDVTVGTYAFDENGKMILPEANLKNGIVEEDGVLYYYIDGVRAYGAGLIELDGNYYYVRSNGQLAIGRYWITNTNGLLPEGFYNFGEDGAMEMLKNGIVAERGSLYYYVDNMIAYNAGVIQIDGNYYYVRSNGEVVNNRTYWITNVGDSGILPGYYVFDENGVMQNPRTSVKNGIVEEDGVLYYYVDGIRAYGAGLVQLEEGCYIYVRSNGQLAIGEYWITNTNGLLEAGKYDFGTDGKLYI